MPIPFTRKIDQQLLEPRLVHDSYATVHHLTEVLYFGGDDVAVFEKPLRRRTNTLWRTCKNEIPGL